jgi:Cohesin domain
VKGPRLSSWVSGLATLLVTALVATPLWDFWHYRGLRTGPGPGLAVGLMLPPVSPRTTRVAGFSPSPVEAASIAGAPLPGSFTGGRTNATRDRRPAPDASESGFRSVSPGSSGGNPPAGASGSRPAQEPARVAPSGGSGPAPGSARPSGSPAVPRTAPHAESTSPAHGPPPETSGEAAPATTTGWLLTLPAPAASGDPQLPPDPQTPLPPPKQLEPAPGTSDPKEVPQALPVLSLTGFADNVAVGQDVTISVRLNGAEDVTSLPFHLLFDPAILQFVSAGNGPATGSLQPVLLASVNPARPGDLAVGLSFIDAGGAFNGSGSLLELRFHALAAGVSSLTFDRASIRGRFSQALEAQFESGSISVR